MTQIDDDRRGSGPKLALVDELSARARALVSTGERRMLGAKARELGAPTTPGAGTNISKEYA